MKIIRIKDRYKSIKAWVIKKTNCGHYYYNQEIKRQTALKTFSRTTRKFLRNMLNLDNIYITRWFATLTEKETKFRFKIEYKSNSIDLKTSRIIFNEFNEEDALAEWSSFAEQFEDLPAFMSITQL
jgi:hypothetical protein